MVDAAFLQARIEALFRSDAAGDLLETNGIERGPAPAVYLTKGLEHTMVRFRSGMSPGPRAAIDELLLERKQEQRAWAATDVPASVVDELSTLIGREHRVRSTSHGPFFGFAEPLQEDPEAASIDRASLAIVRQLFPRATAEGIAGVQPFRAIVDGGCLLRSTRRARVRG